MLIRPPSLKISQVEIEIMATLILYQNTVNYNIKNESY